MIKKIALALGLTTALAFAPVAAMAQSADPTPAASPDAGASDAMAKPMKHKMKKHHMAKKHKMKKMDAPAADATPDAPK